MHMDLQLKGKIVLISGGSRGIGLSVAQLFIQEGCFVAISARHENDLNKAQERLGDCCSTHIADAQDPRACAQLMTQIEERWGRLDIVVTCAGSGVSVSPGNETVEEWQRVIALNLFSSTNIIAAATPLLAKSVSSCIVCISSICGSEVLNAPITYSAAKSALNMAAKSFARPLSKLGIRINIVSPGNIIFPHSQWEKKQKENPDAVEAMLRSEVPLACFGTPESIANAVVFLSSYRSSFTTGANIIIDGGQSRSL